MPRTLIIFALVLILFSQAVPAVAAPRWWPLVPCGLNPPPPGETPLDASYYQPCNRCDLLRLIKNLIDFILYALVPVVATLLFIIAGSRILVGGQYPSQLAAGKKMFWDTIKAILIILVSWLGINTVLKSIAKSDLVPSAWWQLECVPEAPIPTGTPIPIPSGGGTVPAEVQAAARDLLAALGAGSFSTAADCGGSFHARQNIQDMANGTLPAVCSKDCSSSCTANGAVVNAGILKGLLALKNAGFNFTVTSFLTGDHGGGSSHYAGRAVDIVPSAGDRTVWQQARAFLKSRGGNPICENKSDSTNVPDCNAGQVNHIHWTYP